MNFARPRRVRYIRLGVDLSPLANNGTLFALSVFPAHPCPLVPFEEVFNRTEGRKKKNESPDQTEQTPLGHSPLRPHTRALFPLELGLSFCAPCVVSPAHLLSAWWPLVVRLSLTPRRLTYTASYSRCTKPRLPFFLSARRRSPSLRFSRTPASNLAPGLYCTPGLPAVLLSQSLLFANPDRSLVPKNQPYPLRSSRLPRRPPVQGACPCTCDFQLRGCAACSAVIHHYTCFG